MKQILTFVCGALFVSIASCSTGPKVTIYISDPAQGGMEFYNESTGEKGFVPYSDTDKFVAFNQADIQALFNYCSLNKK